MTQQNILQRGVSEKSNLKWHIFNKVNNIYNIRLSDIYVFLLFIVMLY